MHRFLTGVACVLMIQGTAMATPSILFLGGGTPNNMSDDGTLIVGRSSDVYRYAVGGGFELLPGSSNQNVPYCSADGQILASTVRNTAGVGGLPTDRTITARWEDPNVGWENLGIVPMGSNCDSTISAPYAISADGRFIVGLHWINGCTARAFRYDDANGVMTNLGSITGQSTRANSVSDDGSVICGFEHNLFTGARRPAVWVNGVETILRTTGSAVSEAGEAYIVNGAGTLIYGESAAFPDHLVKWTRDANDVWHQVDCGIQPSVPSWVPPGRPLNGHFASAMSDDGNTVVGLTFYGGGTLLVRGAFMYTPSTGVVDITDFMQSSGAVGVSDIGEFQIALDVSADGRKILGWGLFTPDWMIDLDGTTPCVPPLVTSVARDDETDPNGFLIFNASVIGTAGMSFQWYKDGVALTDTPNPYDPNDPFSFTSVIFGATTEQLFIDNVLCSDNGIYHCEFTNACGSAATAPALGTVGAICPGDINGDRMVDLSDLAGLLANFGGTGKTRAQGDLTDDGNVDLSDLAGLLAAFGTSCPCP
ncbi:MAG: hypothetical protein KDA32_14160 [Phycisphaerales bacterium]|nr:hypothetical protein [Phycisphaerales bacterium]